MFVSSTCFDLKQVRADLKIFLESLGLQSILSEYDSFPVDPDVHAVENCFKVIDERTDLFLLVVGGRYGLEHEKGKSVTNMEYQRARANGIPIYVFVQKSILSILPLWKDNPEMDVKSVADSPKLFEFVDSLKRSDGVWVFPFEVAQEITDALRKQLAGLFMDALQLRKRFKKAALPESLAHLQGMPLRLVIERPTAWEYRLFNHVLAQEISRLKRQRHDFTYGIAFGRSEHLADASEVYSWIGRKLAEGERLVDAVNPIVNVALQDALGPDGVPGDPEKLLYAAQRLAEMYRHAIEWAIDTRRVAVADDEYKEIVRIVGTFLNNVITEVEVFSERILRETEEAIANNLNLRGEKKVLDFTLTITLFGLEEFRQEMKRLRELYGLDPEEFDGEGEEN